MAWTWAGVSVWVPAKRRPPDVVDADGGSGGRDVAGDVGLLEGVLRRRDLHGLDDGRVDGTHHHGHERPQPHSEHGKGPAAPADVDEQDHRGEQRDPDEQLQGGQAGVDVGVARSLHVAVLGQVEVVARQDVPDRLHQCHAGQDHRDVRLDLRSHAGCPRLHPDPAVEVVGDDREDRDHDERDEGPTHHERQEGKLEDEEADVLVELRISGVERPAVGEEQVVAPLPEGAGGRDQRDHHGHDGADEHGTRSHPLLVAPDQFVLGPEGQLARGQAVHHGQVDPHEHEEDRREAEEQLGLHLEQSCPHCTEMDGSEPEVVGVEGRQRPQRRQDHDQDDDGDDQPQSPPSYGATRSTRQVLRGSHGAAA